MEAGKHIFLFSLLTFSLIALTIRYTVKIKVSSFGSNPLQRKLGLLPQYGSLFSLKTTTKKLVSGLLLLLRSLRLQIFLKSEEDVGGV